MQNLVDFLVKLIVVWIGDVAHVEDQRSFLHFFERCAKRRQQPFWQVADKSHSVRDEDPTVRGKTQGADRGIERGGHPRGTQYFGASEGVERRGPASVGV